jgi:hypothetical protein
MATGRVPTTANSPLTTKGDLFGYSTTQARVAVGNNGETLVADSSATTGLRWQGNFAAGKNKIINGDFGIWQRGTSFTVASDTYTADRWLVAANGGQTMAFTREAFTAGTAPVSGYEGKYFYQYAVTAAGSGNTYNQLKTRIEDARTLAGQTVVLSFWAKGSASYNITSVGYQNFGTGGSPSSAVLAWSSGNLAVTTSWQRFSYSFTMPSVSGKTFGTNGNDYVEFYINMPTNQTSTTGIWGVQLEAGSVATAFQTATGTLAGELAACQRYYYRIKPEATNSPYGIGNTFSTTVTTPVLHLPVVLRRQPDIETSGTAGHYAIQQGGGSQTCNAVPTINQTGLQVIQLQANVASGLTAGQVAQFYSLSTSGYIGFSAEL